MASPRRTSGAATPSRAGRPKRMDSDVFGKFQSTCPRHPSTIDARSGEAWKEQSVRD